jgi:ribose transport system permease protein
MKKILGIFGVLVAIILLTSIGSPGFLSGYNLENVLRRVSMYSILGLGAAFVIMAGGIDLSIGSMVGLVGSVFPLLLLQQKLPLPVALLYVLGLVVLLGLDHGLLITKLRLQPFVVTLSGLLLYRGIARWITGDQDTPVFGAEYGNLRWLAEGKIPLPFVDPRTFSLPVPVVILLVVVVVSAVFLNLTIYGRYLLATGRNEQAARYSGINTHRITILAYVLCALLTGLGAILFLLDSNSIQPDRFGSFYELYAIAAAVLGGCSLRGGEGSVVGVVLGAALIPFLSNAIGLLGFPTRLEFAIIGVVILVSVVVDELFKRLGAARRLRRVARSRPDQADLQPALAPEARTGAEARAAEGDAAIRRLDEEPPAAPPDAIRAPRVP